MASLIPLVWGSGIVGTCITSAATKMVAVNELGTTLGMLGAWEIGLHIGCECVLTYDDGWIEQARLEVWFASWHPTLVES